MKQKTFEEFLNGYIKEQNSIAGDWNGEDDSFIHEGDVLHEADALMAKDRAEAAEKLLGVMTENDL